MINVTDETNLLIFSPHPDDEILGCGGLMEKVKHHHGKINVSLFTFGDFDRQFKTRKHEFEKVMEFMSVDWFNCLFPDEFHLKLDTISLFDIIQIIEDTIKQINPTICAIPFPSFNQDHRRVYEAAIAALRMPAFPKKSGGIQVIIYEYPQVSWNPYNYHFTPNLYIDITTEINKKIAAFEEYISQNKSDDYAISNAGILSLAAFRGKEISTKFAEAYMLKRGIVY